MRTVSITKWVRNHWAVVILLLLGALLVWLYRYGLEISKGQGISGFIRVALIQCAIYAMAGWLVFKARSSGWLFAVTICFAVLFRVAVLFAPPNLSDDIYRYVWDGRVQAAGINPYRYIPADRALEPLRDDAVYPKINRKDYAHTIYPPAAQGFYLLVTRVADSVTGLKVGLMLCDLVTMGAVIFLLHSFGMPLQRVFFYAWHPLIVWDFAGNGHVDALALALILLAIVWRISNRSVLTGVFLGLATTVKLFPIVLFPALYKRWDWKMPVALSATIVLAYVPYLSVGVTGVLGFLPDYLQEEGIQNGTRFFLLSIARNLVGQNWTPDILYKIFALVVLFAVSSWLMVRGRDESLTVIGNLALLATLFTVLLSPRYAWYFSWLVPFICFLPSVALIYLTCSSFLLYVLWLDDSQSTLTLINSLIYFPFFFLVALSLLARRMSPFTSGQHENAEHAEI